MSRADADAEAVDDTANDEHGDVLRGTDDDASNDPGDGTDLDGDLAYEVRTSVRVVYVNMVADTYDRGGQRGSQSRERRATSLRPWKL